MTDAIRLTRVVYPAAMAMIAQTLVLSPKLYRHFAVLTVSVTALIAIFADGERREDISDHIAVKVAKAEAHRIENARRRSQILVRSTIERKYGGAVGGNQDEAGSDAGDGEVQTASAATGARRPAMSGPPQAMPPEALVYGGSLDSLPDMPLPGMPADVYDRLSRIKKQREQKKGPDKPSSEDLRRMNEISAQRSGVEVEIDD